MAPKKPNKKQRRKAARKSEGTSQEAPLGEGQAAQGTAKSSLAPPEFEDFISGRFQLQHQVLRGYEMLGETEKLQHLAELNSQAKQRLKLLEPQADAGEFDEKLAWIHYLCGDLDGAYFISCLAKNKDKTFRRPENLLILGLFQVKLKMAGAALQTFGSVVELLCEIFDALKSDDLRSSEQHIDVINYLESVFQRCQDGLDGITEAAVMDPIITDVIHDNEQLLEYKKQVAKQKYNRFGYGRLRERLNYIRDSLSREHLLLEQVESQHAEYLSQIEEEVVGVIMSGCTEEEEEKRHGFNLYYMIDKKEQEEALWQGHCRFSKKCDRIATTFLVCAEDVAVGLYNKLKDIHSEFIVKPQLYLEDFEKEKQSAIVFNGRMCSLNTWLEREREAFAGIKAFTDSTNKKDWWNHISPKFKKIFRDVIRGLWCFLDIHTGFSNFSRGILVDDCGHVKLLPCLFCFEQDEAKKDKTILNGLREAMKKIIVADFEDKDDLSSFGIPDDLKLSFDFLMPKNLSLLPCQWLINSCFLWESPERIRFLQKICELMEGNHIKRHETASAVNNAKHDPSPYVEYPAVYSFAVSLNVNITLSKDLWWICELQQDQNSIFYHVFNYGGDYRFPIDLARYMENFVKHHNELEYAKFNSGNLSRIEIEKKLHQAFPCFYGQILIVLYLCLRTGPPGIVNWDYALPELISCFKSS